MGASPSGIGRNNPYPCVGDPALWEDRSGWFGCAATGSVSLLALMPLDNVADVDQMPDACPDEPTLVHVTVCPAHVRPVRRWLQARMKPEDRDQIETMGTDYLMREWGQVEETMEDTRILRLQRQIA